MTEDEVRRGAFGVVPVELGDPLTRMQVRDLREGTQVTVIWSGGNGPHAYVVARDDHDPEVYLVPRHERLDGRLRYYNPATFVGREPRHTRIWLGWMP